MQIDFKNIYLSFGPVEVLHGISLTLKPGQILALLGENGAGKSTLMNVLGGLLRPSVGTLLLDGQKVALKSPNDSIDHGIVFIHQELSPVNDLMVYENMFLGREIHNRLGFLNRQAMRQKARQILDSLDIPLDECTMMRDLDASYKQIVEITRALLCQAKTIIMDEPTTSLAEHEIQLLFEIVRKLASQQVGIIFISHKLNEVKELCTDFAVLRNGELVAEGSMDSVTTEELSEHIVGHEMATMTKEAPQPYGEVVLALKSLSSGRDFKDVSLSVRAGEILGITGLLGDGRSELFRTVFGDNPNYQGEMLLGGKPYAPKSTGDAMRHGIAYVPSNRKENAIIPDLSVMVNGTLSTLQNYTKAMILTRAPQIADFDGYAKDFRLKYGNRDDLITTLSGGNQQKVILARWLTTKPSLLILDNPTQGVDIGAKQEIYEIVKRAARQGMAVVVLSGEGQEITRLCQRALVMFHGEVRGELTGDELNEQTIMKYATGALSR